MDKDNKLSFGVEGFSVVDDVSDSQLAVVEIYVCHDGNNAHNMPIDLSVIKKAKKTLKGKFLVAGYDGDDFEGHEPDEQIVGYFPAESEMKFVEKDGKTYLVAQAVISKVYAKWAYDIFVEDENYRAVSMEITVLGTDVEDDGYEHITKFVFNGVTLLGTSHRPACEGANASIIKFDSENALKFYSKRVKDSDKIKKDFIKSMELAEVSGKEESAKMDEKETVVVDEIQNEQPVVEEQPAVEEETISEKQPEEGFEEEKSDEDTYMEEDESEEKSDEDEKEDESEDDKEESEEKKFESLTNEQKYEVFRSAVNDSQDLCGYVESYDDEHLYIYDYCDGYTYRYSYTLDGVHCTIDANSKTRVMRGGYVEFENYEESVVDFEKILNENCELKEKLAKYEQAEKDKKIESILSEVVDVLPVERIAELRDEAANYSFEELEGFSNKVKAIAFETVAPKAKGQNFERMPLINNVERTSKYGW